MHAASGKLTVTYDISADIQDNLTIQDIVDMLILSERDLPSPPTIDPVSNHVGSVSVPTRSVVSFNGVRIESVKLSGGLDSASRNRRDIPTIYKESV